MCEQLIASWIITAGHENDRECALHEEGAVQQFNPPPPSAAQYDNNPITSYIICFCVEEELGHPSSGASPSSAVSPAGYALTQRALASGFIKPSGQNAFNPWKLFEAVASNVTN